MGDPPAAPFRRPSGALAPLRHVAFARFLLANTTSAVGQFLQGLAVPFLINQMTDSNTWVGAAAFAALIPAVVTTPISGTLADRIDRKRILLVAYVLQGCITGGLLALHQADLLTPWRIIGLLLASGAVSGFQWAPIQSLSAVLVPRELLPQAIRLLSISFTVGRSVGPAAAALILAFAGPGLAFAGTVGCYLVGLLLLSSVRCHWEPGEVAEPFFTQFRAGIDYVRSNPSIRLALRLSFMMAFLGAAFAYSLTASVADDLFGAGGGGLGALAMMLGLGSVLGGIYISGPGGQVRRSRLEAAVALLFAFGMLIVTATPWLYVGFLGYFVMGMTHMLHGVTVNTALQLQLDEEYRGRVMSVWLVALLGGLPLGSFSAGVLGDLLGIRWVMLGYAVLLAGMVSSIVGGAGLALLDEAGPEA
ncbi:MAG: MFS transporter [Actinomycetia bacterium]|nr:MFS transporter [Actinomycetes bacterium]